MRSAEEIKSEIEERFSFFPPFFEPALATPQVLENLRQQTLLAYIENPLPDLFKEKLAALLARYCSVPYCLVCHSAALKPLGMKPKEVLSLLSQDPISDAEIDEHVRFLDNRPIEAWPESGSLLEECVLSCCLAVFLDQKSRKSHEKLRKILKPEQYALLVSFISYNRACLDSAEAHPELSYEADERVKLHLGDLLKEEPGLEEFFRTYRRSVEEQAEKRALAAASEAKKFAEPERNANSRFKLLQERLDRIVDTLELGIFVMDLGTGKATGNDFFREHFGVGRDAKVTSKTFLDLISQGGRESLRTEYEKTMRTGAVMRATVAKSYDGTPDAGPVHLLGWANYDESGRAQGFTAISFDQSLHDTRASERELMTSNLS